MWLHCYYYLYRIIDIVDCISRAPTINENSMSILSVFSTLSQEQKNNSGKDPPNTLTLIVHPTPAGHTVAQGEEPRVITLRLHTGEERNFLLSALRTLTAASQQSRHSSRSPTDTSGGTARRSRVVGGPLAKTREVRLSFTEGCPSVCICIQTVASYS